MSRVIDAFTQFFDDEGDPLVDGWLLFLVSGTTATQKDTYNDSSETIPNTNPVQLSGSGRCPSVFGTGSYRVISYTNDPDVAGPDVQVQLFDPVGGSSGGQLSDWDSETIYDQYSIVKVDGEFYISKVASNQGNEVTVETAWDHINFVYYYNQYTAYNTADVVRSSVTGIDYISRIDTNIGNDPDADLGTNWRVYEKTTYLIMSGGGTLTAYRHHMLTDSDTYNLPLAASVIAGTAVVVELSDADSLSTPTVAVSGSDTLSDVDGADADGELLINGLISIKITLISDGISNWEM